MWLLTCELRRLGFRGLSPRYWQCRRGFGLPAEAYLSVFADGERSPVARGGVGDRLTFAAFHVTFLIGIDHLHFYFHEAGDTLWEPGGHTTGGEIRRYRREPAELRAMADEIAAEFANALGMSLIPRE